MNRFRLVACALALCAGCGGGSSKNDPSSELRPLTRIDPEPAGSNCAAGGSAVRTGLDRNGDGVLEDAEVTSTSYVCAQAQRTLLIRTEPASAEACPNGGTTVLAGIDQDGDGVLADAEVVRTTDTCLDAEPPVVTRSTPILPGSTCADGGSTVEAGHDRSGDGVLQDDEVEQRQTVCGGAVLSASDPVLNPPGCTGWATRIRAGADVNGDGVLADDEVQVTSYVCSAAVYGYEVRTQADLDYLKNQVDLVRGSLVVRSETLKQVYLSGVAVTGAIRAVDSPALVSLGVSPSLLGGDVEIARDPALQTVSIGIGDGSYPYQALPIIGSLSITDCPSLRWIFLSDNLPAIQGSLRVVRSGDDYLYLGAEGLASVGGDLQLEETTGLQAVDVPALETIGGDLRLWGNVDLGGGGRSWDEGLTSRSCIQTVGGRVSVRDNLALGWFYLDCLLRAGSIDVARNAELGSVSVDHLQLVDGDIDLESNPKLHSTGYTSTTPGPTLTLGGSLRVVDNAALFDLSGIGNNLTRADAVLVARNPALQWLHLNHLDRAGSVTIQDNDALTFIGPNGLFVGDMADYLDALMRLSSVSNLHVDGNAGLSRLQLPALRYASYVTVTDNPVLPTCQAQAVLDQLASTPSAQLTGNDDAATCP